MTSLLRLHLATVEKRHSSQWRPEILFLLQEHKLKSFALIDIGCVVLRVRTIRVPDHLRSRMSVCCSPPWTFREHGYGVHVLADGVSSCNKEEVPRADAPSWCTDHDGREHVVPVASCVPHGLSLAWVRSSVCHLVDESSPNFKAFGSISRIFQLVSHTT